MHKLCRTKLVETGYKDMNLLKGIIIEKSEE
jgi:hypothetical protein